MEKIKWTANEMPKTDDQYLTLMSKEAIEKALAFHRSFPQYNQTPLAELKNMAEHLGLKDFFVKDESYRFGLNAFKVLGGSFAMANYIAEKIGKDVADLTYDVLTSDTLRNEFGQATFFTATDGNHGRGVAWAANKLGQKAVVLMPKGSTQTRKENIEKEGAKVTIEEVNYDECVRMANKMAEETENGVMVQDTAWDGYEKIPTWIMQGYGTMALEASKQLEEAGNQRPTHVFVQAGVGSLAGAVVGYFANLYPDNPPKMVVVEAQVADCLYKSAIEKDGKIRFVEGDLQTIMAGLACGEPNTISFDILENHTAVFVSAPDWVSEKGMRMLGAPLKGDPQVISGESGAVAMGLVATAMQDHEYKELREALELDENSSVLMFSTEGDTDPDNYKKILWR
ncbi:diaminopropionate ammonia-lyase [Enterococcus silesiacus]|uniref:Diaminopropionate ammonia-lyase n=1 Tax=Enterococcus silesiacus TaxID=332949 RepID=A0A0S3KA31_9ENTE|nr:diaminopropionate ammonia-lyase [Enterococcus silesiacus]ALS01132.1 diaminopropionate ammonia-lyase [Enterococcus silesiacus]OJG92523.1 diaminopropionate ammonia-lyase family protein [Enterococcus silesiacus]